MESDQIMTKTKMTQSEIDDSPLSLFEGRCGHRWVGASLGWFACPVCGDHDGDHHLRSQEPIAVQVDDMGSETWDELSHIAIAEWDKENGWTDLQPAQPDEEIAHWLAERGR